MSYEDFENFEKYIEEQEKEYRQILKEGVEEVRRCMIIHGQINLVNRAKQQCDEN